LLTDRGEMGYPSCEKESAGGTGEKSHMWRSRVGEKSDAAGAFLQTSFVTVRHGRERKGGAGKGSRRKGKITPHELVAKKFSSSRTERMLLNAVNEKPRPPMDLTCKEEKERARGEGRLRYGSIRGVSIGERKKDRDTRGGGDHVA